MTLKLLADEAAYIAVQLIRCSYDISLDLRFKYGKRDYFGTNPYRNFRLIEIDEDEGRDIILPDGVLILNVWIVLLYSRRAYTLYLVILFLILLSGSLNAPHGFDNVDILVAPAAYAVYKPSNFIIRQVSSSPPIRISLHPFQINPLRFPSSSPK
ncbi:hypothetical protein L2E82_21148 [Cichorium intybus]|uniref:Uncharacterized protein n=1 Tax=Cichorium intybus TaxID=13427 RepID=A0ACB9DV02_CICIN|nr:hypothetical protein L2E82_21148 [Cichorium intybus]